MDKRKFKWIAMVLVALLLGGCKPGGAVTETAPAATTVPTTEEQAAASPTPSVVSDGIRLDPAIVDDPDALLVSGYIYEGLVRLESDIPAPALATSWTVSDDGLDYIFFLRPGVTFSDGTPLDADAVIANFNRWFDPQSPLRGGGSYTAWERIFLGFNGETNADGTPKSFFDGIEKVDDLTVLIHLHRAEPAFLFNLTLVYFGIANPTALAAEGPLYGTPAGSAIGTGPYVLAEWTNEQIVLSPNPNYWGTPAEAGQVFPLR